MYGGSFLCFECFENDVQNFCVKRLVSSKYLGPWYCLRKIFDLLHFLMVTTIDTIVNIKKMRLAF